ncbi:Predicted nucleotidyltransferase component of viral defense system [Eubacterium uniforme]|uniref:Predicted nucleotidyltransferase component of viral defense system n=1 Tax=Eubacterium uniforme TaxID=39495 RepID=A0A1T4W0U7_9FIRM|nr:nucleotidyl transferase AbiEii/AbiGii toxin family protein [Eubacterium uniforme]SKA70361.1 Predicted nucleotidyltransferase component of viral defense system [Eubacterium uniforme]
MAIKNMEASVLTRLKIQSKEEGIPFQMVLQLFAQEEFLRKLSLSKYAENLILKGGMFIYTLTEFDSRPTRDIDFLIKNFHGSLENIEQTMRNICNISTGNDFITLEILGTETISIDKKYPGVKTSFMGRIGRVKIPFSIDVGIDDIIVPNPIKRMIVTRLPDFVSPEVFTYSLESTIAEKFDAILQRMSGTSRMKDFYDIYYLSGIFDFEGGILMEAVKRTLAHRNRELPTDVFEEIDDFKNNDALNIQWNAFNPAKESRLLFDDVLDRLVVFLEPIYQNILTDSNYNKRWNCESKMWI